MPIVARGTELKTIAEIVPGAIQGGDTTAVARTAGGAPVVPVDTDDGAVGCTVDGNGSDIEINAQGTIYIKTQQTIVRAAMVFLPGITGSIVMDVWVVPYALYSLVNASFSICGPSKPTITAAQDMQDSVLIGWNPIIPANSFVVFVVDSSVTPDVKWANLVLDTVLS